MSVFQLHLSNQTVFALPDKTGSDRTYGSRLRYVEIRIKSAFSIAYDSSIEEITVIISIIIDLDSVMYDIAVSMLKCIDFRVILTINPSRCQIIIFLRTLIEQKFGNSTLRLEIDPDRIYVSCLEDLSSLLLLLSVRILFLICILNRHFYFEYSGLSVDFQNDRRIRLNHRITEIYLLSVPDYRIIFRYFRILLERAFHGSLYKREICLAFIIKNRCSKSLGTDSIMQNIV